ncbi:MAG TPA: hypothetical protein VGI82_14425, partial [Chitinophagaceae bacterium]
NETVLFFCHSSSSLFFQSAAQDSVQFNLHYLPSHQYDQTISQKMVIVTTIGQRLNYKYFERSGKEKSGHNQQNIEITGQNHNR